MSAIDWKLGRTGEVCARCGRSFEERDEIVSGLFEEGSTDFKRADYCVACFPEIDATPFSFWRNRWEPRRKPRRLDLDQIRSLFLRTVCSDDEADRELAYLLALLLMRKKRLKLKEKTRDGEREVLWVEAPGEDDGNLIPVSDPQLSAERLEVLDRELRDLLVLT